MATLKQVVSKYPYEADDEGEASPSSQHRHGLSLKTEAAQVSRELKDVLQDRLAHAGVKVLAFNLTDLSYAPEIAQAMLVRQQAEAMVKARRLIVKGAVDISEDAVNQLETKGVKMSETEKTKVVTNLLTVICGDQKATPTLSVGETVRRTRAQEPVALSPLFPFCCNRTNSLWGRFTFGPRLGGVGV